MRVAPAGAIRPNRRAIAQGLSFAQAFANGPSMPWLKRGALDTGAKAFSGSAVRGGSKGGLGMVGDGYWGNSSANNTYAVNQTAGTILMGVVADHASTDGVAHMLCHYGPNVYPGGPSVEMLKFSDNNFYFGIISTSDKRVSFSATGSYAAGDVFTAALTWSPSGQIAYVKGIARGSNASTGLGNTAGSDFSVGTLIGSGWEWANSTAGGVLYALIFDTALTPREIANAEKDMWWWARQNVRSRAAAVAPVTSTLTGTIPVTGSLAGVSGVLGTIAGTIPVTGSIIAGGLHGVVRRRGRYRVYRDVPAELAPAVDLAAGFAEAEVSRVVEEAMRRYRALSLKASVARRTALVQELNTQIVAAVARAAEADDEEALAALL